MRINPLAAFFSGLLILTVPLQPAAGQSAPRALSQSDVQQAAQQHQSVLDQFGGEADPRLIAYVAGVGRRIAGYTNVANAQGAYQLERSLTLNGLGADGTLVPGQKVKLVVYGR